MGWRDDLAVAAGGCVTDPDLLAGVARDWTGRWTGDPAALVAPPDTAAVAATLVVCARHRLAVVPQGGNTGLAGGAVPPAGSVVLSTRRLTTLRVDPPAAQAVAGAGVTIAGLRAAAAQAGLAYGVDLASRDSATVGGTLATNAGGLNVVAYGATRAQVLGVTAVLADGRVLDRLEGVSKEAVGPDLSTLLVGSEGTLAVLTAARLRLRPADPRRVVALLGFADLAAAVAALPVLRSLPGIRAIEYVGPAAREVVAAVAAVPSAEPHLVLVEAAADPEDLAPLADLGEPLVAADPAGRERLFAVRERVTEAVALATAGRAPVRKLDVAIPVDRLAEFVAGLDARVAGRARPVLFGHLAEGSLHVNLLPDGPAEGLEHDVLTWVAACGGSISSEHGVGRQKADQLGLSRSPVELAVLAGLKALFDPEGRLNPGVLFPAPAAVLA